MSTGPQGITTGNSLAGQTAKHELVHLQEQWWWLLLLGILIATCGVAALAFPPFFTAVGVIILSATLMVSGAAMIITSFWAGRWGALLVQLLVGILYLMAGLFIIDCPKEAVKFLTLFIAAMFIVVGVFRIVAALFVKFPQWGWALLNGVLTTIVGIIIYKNLPESAIWVIGLLVGIEMLFNGVNWIMLGLAVRNLPKPE
jgi:uncharacterized membrane protein HdeD (DUF308 family)